MASRRPAVHDFPLRPSQVTWEMTQACDWKSTSRRGAGQPTRDKRDLPTAEAFHLIDQVASMHVPLLALTGGDPLSRLDLQPIVQYASGRAVRTSLTLLPPSLLTRESITDLKECGLMRLAFWLHGSTAALHDPFWGMANSYRHTLEAVGWCNEAQLPIQINTIVARRNFHDVDPMIELLTRFDVVLWNVFFLVPSDPDQIQEVLSAEQHEEAFSRLYAASKRVRFQIKTTEGQHYQRYLLQKRARESRGRMTEADAITCTPQSVSDGRNAVFVNHAGEVYPSRFLPLSAGNVTTQPLPQIYNEAPLLVFLRDSSKLKGKCRRCSMRNVCGGSRARAYAMTGDVFAEEPCCAYEP